MNVCRPNLRRAAMALGVRVGLVKRAESAPNRSSAAARAGAGPARKPSEEEVHALRASSADKQATRAADDARASAVKVKDRFRMVAPYGGDTSEVQTGKLSTGKGPRKVRPSLNLAPAVASI